MSLNPFIKPTIGLGLVNDRLPALGWRNSARVGGFMSMGGLLAGLPGGDSKSYAPSPVWRDSTTKEVKYQPLPKHQAVKLWHKARRFERQTRQPGKQDGALGRNGLAVLHALLFDFLNYASGKLCPAIASIADRACISKRSAERGLVSLKAYGVVNWLRRCVEEMTDGRFTLRQLTNAYAVLPSSQWLGFQEPPPAPPPDPATWGATPPLPDVVTVACQERAAGASIAAMCAALESDASDGLAAMLARLGRNLIGRNC